MKIKLINDITSLCVCVCLCFQPSQVKAQCSSPTNLNIDPLQGNWSYSLDGTDHLEDVAFDFVPIDANSNGVADDGVVAVGWTQHTGSPHYKALIVRLNASGGLVWSQEYAGPGNGSTQGNTWAYSVVQTSDGNILYCGSTSSTTLGSPANSNVWVDRLNLSDGTEISTWPQEYGGSGNEDGWDIKVDPTSGYYVIAGSSGAVADGDLTGDNINGKGDYWVLQINPSSNSSPVWQHTYHGIYHNALVSDDAHSVMIDDNGDYIVTGFCKTCESDSTHQELMMLKLTSSGSTVTGWPKIYGYYSTSNHEDQGSYNVIQTNDGGYVCIGVSHPLVTNQCFLGNKHDVWVLKTDNTGTDSWSPGCRVDDGITYGGSKKDEGRKGVDNCYGYVIVGDTKSSVLVYGNNDEVSCNHDNTDPLTSDIWIAKVNSSTGALEWNESLGDIYDDIGYSIKPLPDGSYVLSGQLGVSSTNVNFYVKKFEFMQCDPPGSLVATPSGCAVTFSWVGKVCDQSYELKYRLVGTTTWTTVTQSGSSYGPVTLSAGTYAWKVKTKCSPNVYSSFANGTNVTLSCKLANEISIVGNELLSAYPNPSDGSFNISLRLSNSINYFATIEILDQVGKVISYTKADAENGFLFQQMSVNYLPSGFYWIKIIAEGRTWQAKLILQKK